MSDASKTLDLFPLFLTHSEPTTTEPMPGAMVTGSCAQTRTPPQNLSDIYPPRFGGFETLNPYAKKRNPNNE